MDTILDFPIIQLCFRVIQTLWRLFARAWARLCPVYRDLRLCCLFLYNLWRARWQRILLYTLAYLVTFIVSSSIIVFYLEAGWLEHHHSPPAVPTEYLPQNLLAQHGLPVPPVVRIMQASLEYTRSPSQYRRALILHEAWDRSAGYEQRILSAPIVKGAANLFVWLGHLVTEELLKHELARAEWILYVWLFP